MTAQQYNNSLTVDTLSRQEALDPQQLRLMTYSGTKTHVVAMPRADWATWPAVSTSTSSG